MRNLLALILLFPILLSAQSAEQASLLYNWEDPTLPGSFAFNNTYNEIWGLVANDREIGVIGSTAGTHFFDVTDPENAVELNNSFVQGAVTGGSIIHRDYHDYGCYLYAVADEGASTLQIIDYSDLPNSTTVVYDSDDLFRRVHNIFIDTATAKLYACAVSAPGSFTSLKVYSLADPISPQLIGSYGVIDGFNIPVTHDIYVRNDTAYLNGSNYGLLVVDFSNMADPQILGTLDSYVDQGYNHSGWLSDDGKHYFLADENHGLSIKTLSVEDLSSIEVVATFDAESTESGSIPHNLLVRGNYLYASYYYDGLQVYEITDPEDPRRVAFYDTYPGQNVFSYEGAWGVYPHLPSGNILVSDMQTGLYIFESVDESIVPTLGELGSPTNCSDGLTSVEVPTIQAEFEMTVFPQPVHQQLFANTLATDNQIAQFFLTDLTGKRVASFGEYQLEIGNQSTQLLLPSNLSAGMYLLEAHTKSGIVVEKIIKQ